LGGCRNDQPFELLLYAPLFQVRGDLVRKTLGFDGFRRDPFTVVRRCRTAIVVFFLLVRDQVLIP
jgi:hypothetical protein